MANVKHTDVVDIAGEELSKYGFDVQATHEREFDIDIIATTKNDTTLKIVVRSVSPTSQYTFIEMERFDVTDEQLYMLAVYSKSKTEHDLYLFPATLWAKSEYPFKAKPYDKPELISKPEYGITFSQKAIDKIGSYRLNLMVNKLD